MVQLLSIKINLTKIITLLILFYSIESYSQVENSMYTKHHTEIFNYGEVIVNQENKKIIDILSYVYEMSNEIKLVLEISKSNREDLKKIRNNELDYKKYIDKLKINTKFIQDNIELIKNNPKLYNKALKVSKLGEKFQVIPESFFESYGALKGFNIAKLKQNEKYLIISHFSDGLSKVTFNNRVGYIDSLGIMRTPYTYLPMSRNFNNGLAYVEIRNQGKFMIDKNFKKVYNLSQFDSISDYQNGYINCINYKPKYSSLNHNFGNINLEKILSINDTIADKISTSFGDMKILKNGDYFLEVFFKTNDKKLFNSILSNLNIKNSKEISKLNQDCEGLPFNFLFDKNNNLAIKDVFFDVQIDNNYAYLTKHTFNRYLYDLNDEKYLHKSNDREYSMSNYNENIYFYSEELPIFKQYCCSFECTSFIFDISNLKSLSIVPNGCFKEEGFNFSSPKPYYINKYISILERDRDNSSLNLLSAKYLNEKHSFTDTKYCQAEKFIDNRSIVTECGLIHEECTVPTNEPEKFLLKNNYYNCKISVDDEIFLLNYKKNKLYSVIDNYGTIFVKNICVDIKRRNDDFECILPYISDKLYNELKKIISHNEMVLIDKFGNCISGNCQIYDSFSKL